MIKCSTSTKKCHVKYQICNRSGRAPIASKIKVHIQHKMKKYTLIKSTNDRAVFSLI